MIFFVFIFLLYLKTIIDYYKEIETVDGYILSEEKVFFEVNKNDEILEYTLVNNKISIDVPDTEKNNNIIDYLSYIILSIGDSK